MKAGRYTKRGHFDCKLLDTIFEFQSLLGIEVLVGHQRVDMTKPVLIRRGSFYIDEVLKSGVALPAPVVEATAAVRAAVEQPAAPSATGSDSVAIVGRVTRQQETIHAAAANAAKTLAGLQLAQKDPGPQRCSQQEQAQRLLGKSPSPDGKWRGAPLASDLEVFLSDPDVVNKDVLKSKGGAAAKRAAATKLLALASARGVALSLHNCQTLMLDICVAEQSFLVNQNAGHAELQQRLNRPGVQSAQPASAAARLALFPAGVPQLPGGPVSQQPVAMPSTGVGAGVVSMPPDDGNAGGGGVARPTVQASIVEARERNCKRMHEQRRSQGVRPQKAPMSREDRLARAAAGAKRRRQALKAKCAEDGDVEEEGDDQEDDADAGDNNSGGGGPGGGGGGGGGGSGGGAGMTGQGSRHSKRNKH